MHRSNKILLCLVLCALAGHKGTSIMAAAVPVASSGSAASKPKFQEKLTEQLDTNGDYVLSWSIDEETGEIEFEIEAATLGYVGLGISPKGSMADADLFMGGVDTTGIPKLYFGDYHGGPTNGAPLLDARQDWKLLDARENATHTYLKISRLLDTCDDEDYPITEENTARVIWSLGATDDLSCHGSTHRGTKSVNLITFPEPEVDLERLMRWNIIVSTTMPSADTTYWCTIHKQPALASRHHVVGFHALLETPLAVKHTHHFIVSKCTVPPGHNATEFFEPWLGHEGELCFGGSHDLPSEHCQKNLFVWAVGGRRTLFPLEAGYPIGGIDNNQDAYYMLEVHYDNPEQLAGLHFNTGLEIYYTNELRPHEATMFEVGHVTNPQLLIPPLQAEFVIAGHCAPFCTRKLPSTGLRVFNVGLHSHISGRRLKLRHFRGKEELKWLAFDDNYDFDFQQNRALREEIVIQPGDHLTFECTYDSTWNNGHVVAGGLSSRQEMCLAFLWTYTDSDEPITVDSCKSTYPVSEMMADFGIANWTEIETTSGRDYLIHEPQELAGLGFVEALNTKFVWTPEFIADRQRKHRYGVMQSSCCDRNAGECSRDIVMYPDAVTYAPEPTC